MLFNKHYCFGLLILLGGCEIIPSFNQCPSPKFMTDDTTVVDQYFLTQDVLAKFCPAETPKALSYPVTENITLSLYLKDEWVYLKATDGLKQLTIYAPNMRIANVKNYTHVLPLSALSGDVLAVTIDKTIEYRANFTLIHCTCVR